MNKITTPATWLTILAFAVVATAQDEPEPAPEPAPVVETDPIVLDIIQSDPATPLDLIDAAKSLLDFNRPQPAQGFLKKLLESQPGDSDLVQLYRQSGSSLFVRLSVDQRIQPEGRQIGKAVLDAANRWARDPRRIETLVQKALAGASAAKRAAAIHELQTTPTAAVTPLMRVLQAGNSAEQSARARGALVTLGQPVVDPLIGYLHAPDPKLQTEAIWILSRLEADRAVPFLLRPYLATDGDARLRGAAAVALETTVGSRPSPADGQELLRERIGELMAGKTLPGEPDHEQMITLWRWEAAQQTSVARRFTIRDAAVMTAADLAYDLYHLWPDQSEFKHLYLLSILEVAKRTTGVDRPMAQGTDTAFGQAAEAGTEVVQQVLIDATRLGFDGAAMAAAEVLGQIGDGTLLTDAQGGRRPLTDALGHPNPRVRVAAARAIMNIDPRQPYPGAGNLTRLVGQLIQTRAEPRVLIGIPTTDTAYTVAGYLRELGFEVDQAVNGRQLSRMAALSPDYDFLLISDSIEGPLASELLQHVRQHPFTERLPIGLLTKSTSLSRSQELADRDTLTIAFPRPVERDAVMDIANQLVQLAGRDHMGSDLRVAHATEALQWLSRLAENDLEYSFYEIFELVPALESALETPNLTTPVTEILGKLGTPQAQTTLLEMVLQSTLPLAHRQAAADGLAEAIRRRRVQLSPKQIATQYQRYQRGEGLDDDTRRLLGFVLGRIEATAAETTATVTD